MFTPGALRQPVPSVAKGQVIYRFSASWNPPLLTLVDESPLANFAIGSMEAPVPSGTRAKSPHETTPRPSPDRQSTSGNFRNSGATVPYWSTFGNSPRIDSSISVPTPRNSWIYCFPATDRSSCALEPPNRSLTPEPGMNGGASLGINNSSYPL